jgi:CRP-like cAMP-binding protein
MALHQAPLRQRPASALRQPFPRQQLLLQRDPALAALPFALESTLHERPASARSRLSGLDSGPRRALLAMNQRPPSAKAMTYGSGRLTDSSGTSGKLLTMVGVRRQEAARRRWAFVRSNLWRLLRDERQRLDLQQGLVGSSACGFAITNWKARSVEAALRASPLLCPISETELRALMAYSSLTTVPRYAQLFRKGLPVTSCFLVLRGTLRLAGQRGTSRVIEPGALCGGGGWLECALHPDTATALQPCVLLNMRAADARLDQRLQELAARLADSLGSPWKVDLLRHYVPFFTDLPQRSLTELAPLFRPLLVEGGQMLIREGQVGEAVYVLVQGEVRVFRQPANGPSMAMELTRINDQSEVTYFGELALYYRQPRSASVQAVDRCFLLELDAAHFETFAALVPDFGKRVKALVAISDAKHAAAAAREAKQDGGLEDCGDDAARQSITAPFSAALAPDDRDAVGSFSYTGKNGGEPHGRVEPLAAWVDSLPHTTPRPASSPLQQRRPNGAASREERCVTVRAGNNIGFTGLKAQPRVQDVELDAGRAILLARSKLGQR